jgi:SAM-dependent methyltransferase
MGQLERTGNGAAPLARRHEWHGRDRAGLRHGLCLGLDGAARRAGDGHRRIRRAAGDGAAADGGARARHHLLEGNAEATGLPDASFDFAISEYGAAIWCDPDLWLPEAHRLLRPGGTLVFLGNHPMTLITTPPNGAPCERVLHRPYRDLTGADWTRGGDRPGGIEFNRTISGWMALFDTVGFDVLKYHELFAPRETRRGTGTPSHRPGPRITRPNRSGRCAAGDERVDALSLAPHRAGAYISD